MGVIHLCAAAKEAEYVRRLADYVRQSPYGRTWRVSGFSSEASLTQYLAGGYPADLLLVPPDMADRVGKHRPGVPMALLVRHAADERPGGAGGNDAREEAEVRLPEVRQYQPMPRLMRRLAAVMAENGLRAGSRAGEAAEPGGTCVIAVYSPSGGSGVTTTALGLAHQAGLSGAGSFYLNLEPFGWAGMSGPEQEEDGLSAMLYALQSRPHEAGAAFERLRRRHPALRTDLFGGICPPEERFALGAAEAGLLLETAAGSPDIGVVVVDLGSSPTEAHLESFARSRAVFWLVPAGESGAAKTEAAVGYMRRRWGERFEAAEPRIKFVAAPARADEARMTGIMANGRVRSAAAVLPDVPALRRQGLSVAALRVPELQEACARLLAAAGMKRRGGEAGGGSPGAYGSDVARTR